MVSRARATRGRGLPSLDARTWESDRQPLTIGEWEGWTELDGGSGGMDQVCTEKVQCRHYLNRSGHSMKVGRNAPCPCGSGTKFKKCHDNFCVELPILIQQARINKHIAEEGKRLLEQRQAEGGQENGSGIFFDCCPENRF